MTDELGVPGWPGPGVVPVWPGPGLDEARSASMWSTCHNNAQYANLNNDSITTEQLQI